MTKGPSHRREPPFAQTTRVGLLPQPSLRKIMCVAPSLATVSTERPPSARRRELFEE
jgi:hypothetical protein